MSSLLPESIKREMRYLKGVYGSKINSNPSKKLKLIAVTGTSGKSTTAAMIFHILKEAGLKVGMISTIGAKVNDISLDTGLHVTTPDPIQIQKILKTMVKQEAEYVVVEVSSHALDQKRIGPLEFDYAVFTNIKRDHLDWHGSWDAYATAKASLLKKLKLKGIGIVNRDDESYEFLHEYSKRNNLEEKIITYSERELQEINLKPDEIKFKYTGVDFSVPVIGRFNIFNLLAAISLTQKIGIDVKEIARTLNSFAGLPGRMEVMQKDPFFAIVDFAHNTDSLEKSLEDVREFVSENGKVIVVFGSAGLRDVEKRFTMGEAAGRLADVVVVTAEDPRTEKLYDINSKIIEGAKQSGAKLVKRFATNDEYSQFMANFDLAVEPKSVYVFDEESVDSRFDAIDFAVKIAKKGDVVITEGKGHELSLAFGKTEYAFTDQAAVERALKNLAS